MKSTAHFLPKKLGGNWECCALRVSLVPGCPRCGAGYVMPPWGAQAQVMYLLRGSCHPGMRSLEEGGTSGSIQGGRLVPVWVQLPLEHPVCITSGILKIPPESVVVFALSCATYFEGLKKTSLLYLPRYLLFLLLILHS